MNTITLCYTENRQHVTSLKTHFDVRLSDRFVHLKHERRVEHVLRCQVETFIQVLVRKFSEELDVVQAVGDGRDFLQANI